MLRWLLKTFMAFHAALIRRSRGRIGTRFANQTFLLLHTVGRRSGLAHVTPISYFSADGCYFLVGSNWGRDRHASWYYNLMTHPQASIEVDGSEIPVLASLAEGSQYDELWAQAVKRYPPYKGYKRGTPRHIPIIILTPISS